MEEEVLGQQGFSKVRGSFSREMSKVCLEGFFCNKKAHHYEMSLFVYLDKVLFIVLQSNECIGMLHLYVQDKECLGEVFRHSQ